MFPVELGIWVHVGDSERARTPTDDIVHVEVLDWLDRLGVPTSGVVSVVG